MLIGCQKYTTKEIIQFRLRGNEKNAALDDGVDIPEAACHRELASRAWPEPVAADRSPHAG